MRDLVSALETEVAATATVGVGCPVSVCSRTGRLRNANAVFLNGMPLREDLAAALARDIRLANDGNCLALSEAQDGAGMGAQVVFAAVLGTGCGGGLWVPMLVR